MYGKRNLFPSHRFENWDARSKSFYDLSIGKRISKLYYIIIQKIYFPRNFPSTKYKKEDSRVFQVVKLASRKIINDRTSKREGDSLSSSPGWLDLDRSIRRTGIARNIFTRLLQLSSQEEESPSVVGYLFSKQNSAGRGGVARS